MSIDIAPPIAEATTEPLAPFAVTARVNLDPSLGPLARQALLEVIRSAQPHEIAYAYASIEGDEIVFALNGGRFQEARWGKVHQAARSGDAGAVVALLASGIPVDAKNAGGFTPLAVACSNSQEAIIDLLLASGADTRAVTNANDSVLVLASTSASSIVRKLLESSAKEDVNLPNSQGFTPLMTATCLVSGHPVTIDHTNEDEQMEIMQMLLNEGADPAMVNSFGRTALMGAAASGSRGMVELLLEHGASALGMCHEGLTVLDYALQAETRGFPGALQALARCGAPNLVPMNVKQVS